MTTYIFDIETNGFLEVTTRVHCLVLKNPDTGEVLDFSDDKYGPGSIERGVRLLHSADRIIGHNVIKFDVPVLRKLFPWFNPKWVRTVEDVAAGRGIIDTLTCSRLIWSDLFDSDAGRVASGRLPREHLGSHGLEAWGYRLRLMKGDYSKDKKAEALALGITDPEEVSRFTWGEWSQEMHDYCIQDVEVTHAFYAQIQRKSYAPTAVWLEHRFAEIVAMQERHGFGFNEKAAAALYVTLVGRRVALSAGLTNAFPPRWKPVEDRTCKRSMRKWTADPNGADTRRGEPGYFTEHDAGSVSTKIEWTHFNASSRHHIAERLKEKGWDPQEFTPSGQPKIDETILEKLPYPEAALLAEHFLVEKRIGQIAEGDQAWLKLARKGRIHGSVNTNGAVTGRCTHSRPNVAQTPSVGSPYGAECRALFEASAGRVLVGVDLSGLELRCLAHFMARYDAGEYGRVLLEGDVHWVNVQALGLTDEARDEHSKLHTILRNNAKTFIYAFLYGAGDEKIGSVVFDIIIALKKAGLPYEAIRNKYFGTVESPGPEHLKVAGAALKRSFLKKTPALKKLRDAVQAKAKASRAIAGLDGRILLVRSDHAALNTLLQSAGALIAKLATVLAYDDLSTRGKVFGKDYALLAHIHDEMQLETKPDFAVELGEIVKNAMQRAGEYFNFRLPIAGEAKSGANWRDTH